MRLHLTRSVNGNIHVCRGRTIKSLKWFFIISCGLLLFIAAGLVSSGVVFFTSAGLFGTTFPYEVRLGACRESCSYRQLACVVPCILCGVTSLPFACVWLQNAPWYNKILWDTSSCCNMYTNEFWSLVRALFGYTGE
jgi:hypothetical protein